MVQVITLECGRLGEAPVFVPYDCMLFKTLYCLSHYLLGPLLLERTKANTGWLFPFDVLVQTFVKQEFYSGYISHQSEIPFALDVTFLAHVNNRGGTQV